MPLEQMYKSILPKIPGLIQKLEQIGYDVEKDLSYLDNGINADVYLVDDKYVLKFTTSGTDYSRWKELIGHKYKHIATTLFASELIHTDISDFFLIVQNYYETSVFNEDYIENDDIWSITGMFLSYIREEMKKTKNFRSISFDDVYYRFKFDMYKDYNIKVIDNQKTEDFLNQFFEALKELNDAGYWNDGYLDIHVGNVKLDDKGVLKIIDF